METDRGNDVLAFRSFLDQQIEETGASLTLEEALGLWEYENSSESERAETLESIRDGFQDLEAGRIRSAREVFERLRRKYQLPE